MNQPALHVTERPPGWLPTPEELDEYARAQSAHAGACTAVPDEDDGFDALAANREYAEERSARW